MCAGLASLCKSFQRVHSLMGTVASHTVSNSIGVSIRIGPQAATLRHDARRAQECAELDERQLEGLEHPTCLGLGAGAGVRARVRARMRVRSRVRVRSRMRVRVRVRVRVRTG